MLLLALIDLGSDSGRFFASRNQMALFVLSALAMMLFRKNGVYAFAVMALILLLYVNKKFYSGKTIRDSHEKAQRPYLRKMALLLCLLFYDKQRADFGAACEERGESGDPDGSYSTAGQDL
jgi:hypothetical protein